MKFSTFDKELHIIESVEAVVVLLLLHELKPKFDLGFRRLGELGLRNVKATENIATKMAFESISSYITTPNHCISCHFLRPLHNSRKLLTQGLVIPLIQYQ